MTKENTIEVLKGLPWRADKYSQSAAAEAVSKAIACIEAIDYFKDYIEEYARGLEKYALNGHEVWKEEITLKHVKTFIEGYEKGVFDG